MSENYKMSEIFGNLPKRVLPADSKVKFSLEITDDFFIRNSSKIKVRYIRDDWRRDDGSVAEPKPYPEAFWQNVRSAAADGRLEFEVEFRGEAEHYVGISVETEDGARNEDFYFYTLAPDMIRYKAFKGNPHSHSTRSDGAYGPGIVAAYMRRAGFDFTALTDHDKYEPSLEAAGALAPFDSGLECYPGEEVTGIGETHILSLGASESVTAWKNARENDFPKLVEERKKEFNGLPEHELNALAQFDILAAKVSAFGGLAVFCHPYWKYASRFAATNHLADLILRRGCFDALELGNYNVPRTALINAKLQELIRECGFRKPLIGSSDWHGRPTQKENIACTVIFAKSPCMCDFMDAVRAERSVSIGGYLDEFPFGSFRFVKYTLFLMEHFFRKYHDPICYEQGELLLKALGGNHAVQARITELKGKLEKLYNSFFS